MSEIIAKTRYAKSTARKLRAVAVLVKNKPATTSMTILQHTPQKAAGILAKTVKSAIYNAANNFNFNKDELIIKNIIINEGPAITRFRAMARGSGSAYKRKTAHITVILISTAKAGKSGQTATRDKQVAKENIKSETKVSKKTTSKVASKPKGTKTTVSVKKRK